VGAEHQETDLNPHHVFLEDSLLMSIKLANTRSPAMLSVYAGHKIAIHNTGDSKLSLKKGLCVLGFGIQVH
jgi:hypothetical protein